jgi:hypothetical protein
MSAAHISLVEIGAAHDGDAELIVTLTYPNGGQTRVALDEYAARILLDSLAVVEPEKLIGAGWEDVRDALAASSNRYVGASRATATQAEGMRDV